MIVLWRALRLQWGRNTNNSVTATVTDAADCYMAVFRQLSQSVCHCVGTPVSPTKTQWTIEMPFRVTYERGAETGCTLTPPGEYDRAVIWSAAMPAVASHLYCCSNLLLLVGGSDRGWLTWYARVLYGEVEFEVLVTRLHVHEVLVEDSQTAAAPSRTLRVDDVDHVVRATDVAEVHSLSLPSLSQPSHSYLPRWR